MVLSINLHDEDTRLGTLVQQWHCVLGYSERDRIQARNLHHVDDHDHEQCSPGSALCTVASVQRSTKRVPNMFLCSCSGFPCSSTSIRRDVTPLLEYVYLKVHIMGDRQLLQVLATWYRKSYSNANRCRVNPVITRIVVSVNTKLYFDLLPMSVRKPIPETEGFLRGCTSLRGLPGT